MAVDTTVPPLSHTYYSCGGTLTAWETPGNPDDFPEHAALHAKIVDLYRQLNALKDVTEREVGWWTRRRLTRYLRTR